MTQPVSFFCRVTIFIGTVQGKLAGGLHLLNILMIFKYVQFDDFDSMLLSSLLFIMHVAYRQKFENKFIKTKNVNKYSKKNLTIFSRLLILVCPTFMTGKIC